MKQIIKSAIAAFCFTLTLPTIATEAPKVEIIKAGNGASFVGPDKLFTGVAKVDMLFSTSDEINASGAYVTFAPGARSAWHTHPAGQRLVVTSGVGLTQEWGGKLQKIHIGDVVICPAGVKHWHGASPDSMMTHFTITGDKNGKNVTWMEKVSDQQYAGN